MSKVRKPLFTFKPGVQLLNGKGFTVQQYTVEAMATVFLVYKEQGYLYRTVTSVCDPAPGRRWKSKHRTGDAFDARTWANKGGQMTEEQKLSLASKIREVLGPDWDVVTHTRSGKVKNHFHIEYDPK